MSLQERMEAQTGPILTVCEKKVYSADPFEQALPAAFISRSL